MKRNDRTKKTASKLVFEKQMIRELTRGELAQGVGGVEGEEIVIVDPGGGGGSFTIDAINC